MVRDNQPRFRTVARRTHLPDEIARVLDREIAKGTLGKGQRLPTESALAEQFGVSRNVVREAIARLKNEGLVETRQGSGAFVSASPANLSFRIGADDESSPDALRHIFELRIEVEVGAAALAAERRTEAQLAAIREAVDAIARAITGGEDGTAEDAAFHHAVAAAANNPCFTDFMAFLAARIGHSIAVARDHSARFQALPEKVQREHERIVRAIAGRDPEGARRAVRAHLVNAAGRLALFD